MTVTTSEWPLATREECWRALRPAQEFSESAFRRFRSLRVVSNGLRLDLRARGQLAGHHRFYSRLNLLAADAYRGGRTDRAIDLAARAAAVEQSPEFSRLLRALVLAGVDGPGLVPAPDLFRSGRRRPEVEELAECVLDVCSRTDVWQEIAPGVHARLLARVDRVGHDGADLSIQSGERVSYAQAKLASIRRDTPGSKVWLYLVDLGGTDELVRARPAVEVKPAGRGQRRRLYDVGTTVLTEEQARSLAAPREDEPAVPLPSLSGLRFRA